LSSNPHDVAAALDGLSNFVTPDLARDVSADMFAMLNHSRAHVRKRAVLTLFKIFLKYPETLEQNYGRLREKLEDPDPGQ
jgi:AP-3 complex subunit delta-1